MSKPDFRSILRTLTEREVDFIVVGGVAMVLTGAAYNTFDLDLVHSNSSENVARLLVALEELDAHYRVQPERRFRPNASHLTSPGHQLLHTRWGPLDLLGQIGKGRAYADLLPHSMLMEFRDGLSVRVLDVETQIAVKEETGREKDRAALLLLRHVLEESRKK